MSGAEIIALAAPAAIKAIDALIEELSARGAIDRVQRNHDIARAKLEAREAFRRELQSALEEAAK